ncbi:hypothetical protein JXI42_00800 [bacterium]|nr:hypothetical protein [bacterium]
MTNDAEMSISRYAWVRDHARTVSFVGIIGLTLLVTFVVYMSSWVSDDAFITFRYVNNTINGYGAVFNVGEYVMGYTHPLWYLLLVACTFFLHNEILTAVALSILLTVVFLLLLGWYLLKRANNSIAALIVFGIACSAFISSDIWVSFQTSGLENPLAHLLLLLAVSEAYFHSGKKPAILLLWLSLLCLTRPDYALFAIPVGILVIPRLRSIRNLAGSLLAVMPLIVWLLFAWGYYGSMLPNSGAAKLGVYLNLFHAFKRGLIYLTDWCMFDSFAAGVTIISIVFCGFAFRKNKAILAVLTGIIIYAIWVMGVGGDFMRGRLFMPVFTASVVIASYHVIDWCKNRSWCIPNCYLFSILFLLFGVFQSAGNAVNWNAGLRKEILNERRYYPGYSLRSYLREGKLVNPHIELTFVDDLREYAEVCGSLTIHHTNPGTVGYLAGPKVTVIDLLGLTDRYIAALPKEYQFTQDPRPGHVGKYVPIKYLASRGDIALMTGWEKGVLRRDCTMTSSLKQLIDSPKYLGPGMEFYSRGPREQPAEHKE